MEIININMIHLKLKEKKVMEILYRDRMDSTIDLIFRYNFSHKLVSQ